MISKKMEAALNNHIQEEMYSSYLYLSMALFCHDLGLNGFAHWMRLQSKEEWGHAMKMLDYLLERGGHVDLKEIKKPPASFKTAHHIMELTLEHERKVTALIQKLHALAGKEEDTATQIMLQWFIGEQVEEEATVTDILQKLKFIAEKSSGILYLDKELKKREA